MRVQPRAWHIDMILIHCPYCGPREETEFLYGGESIVRPLEPSAETDDNWARYLHTRANNADTVSEQWWHSQGCQMWLWVKRNRTTHVIDSVRPFGETQ